VNDYSKRLPIPDGGSAFAEVDNSETVARISAGMMRIPSQRFSVP
jgi:hypothetical protein